MKRATVMRGNTTAARYEPGRLNSNSFELGERRGVALGFAARHALFQTRLRGARGKKDHALNSPSVFSPRDHSQQAGKQTVSHRNA